jgi:hypothetical protein
MRREEKMRIDGDDVKFRTGRTAYANCGLMGIGTDAYQEIIISHGYTGVFPDGEPLTKDEREELAAYMINQWALFGQKEIKT